MNIYNNTYRNRKGLKNVLMQSGKHNNFNKKEPERL